ncbi:MAG TPA: hypothetical protein VIY86_03175, partial [Pirellulaceae bacterium]
MMTARNVIPLDSAGGVGSVRRFAVWLPLVILPAVCVLRSWADGVAYVAVDELDVHSGPGPDFYATSRLPRGARLEVVQEMPEWIAIRPPEGSFSWLDARNVFVEGMELSGTVRRDFVRARA